MELIQHVDIKAHHLIEGATRSIKMATKGWGKNLFDFTEISIVSSVKPIVITKTKSIEYQESYSHLKVLPADLVALCQDDTVRRMRFEKI